MNEQQEQKRETWKKKSLVLGKKIYGEKSGKTEKKKKKPETSGPHLHANMHPVLLVMPITTFQLY